MCSSSLGAKLNVPIDLDTLEISAAPDPFGVWTHLAQSCPDAWFWHSWRFMEFISIAAQKNDARNLSFFVLLDGKPIGLVPLMVERIQIGSFSGCDAAYYGGPLPWPAFVPDIPCFEEVEGYAFQELERRARTAGAGRIRIRLSPPRLLGNEQQRLVRAISVHHYLDASYVSHSLSIQDDTLRSIRDRYRRYVKKFMPHYNMAVIDGEAVTPEIEETYFQLHVKDVGGQFRSRESYHLQANLAREREAFYVTATHLGRNVIAGMLLISVYKGAAYDNSVAVDPGFQDEYVSHLLKWTAIEALNARAVQIYELGEKAVLPTTISIPSAKNRGISYFKEGWSRDSTKLVVAAEKFLDFDFLCAITSRQLDAVKTHCALEAIS